MLHKNLPNSVKDVDAQSGVVCGYASSFNVVDDGNDMVLPGAFTKTIAQQGPGSAQPRIKFLYQHDTTAILGVPQVLKEDGFGLYFEAKIAPTTLGRDVLTLYQAGCITEHSIGYETVQAEWDRAKAVRLLKELRLFEFSSVTFGMNPETPTVAVKSLADPSRLTAWATKAAALDSLLHSGTLRSDALCETLERELKALHAALAPMSQAASERPYTIQGVLDSMNDLKSRLDGTREMKGATQADKDAQEARSKKYGIGIKDGGNVTKPGQWKDLDDSDFGDPVNYRYPMPDKAHADNAASRFGAETARAEYTKAEQAIIGKRIAAAQKKFSEDKDDAASSDGGKAAQQMTTRMVKGSSGDLAVSADGTHAAYTGTHTHSHKAMGSQGSDVMHEHEHSHKGNANHGHDHTAVDGTETASDATAEQEAGEPVKARRERRTYKQHLAARQRKTFAEHYQEQQCCDLLRDWQDVVLAAFTSAVYDAFQIGDEPASDISDALDGLKDAVNDWVAEGVKYGLSGYLDAQGYDGGTEYQMQGGSTHPYYDGYMSRTPLAMPDAPAPLRKAGRQISGANRAVITDALDGMSEAMKAMKAHHGAIADLMTKTDPDAVRQDEDNTQGDDDSQNGGTDINKGRSHTSDPTRRSAAVYTTRAATTHHNGASNPMDVSAILADLDALKGRLAHVASTGGKA